VTFDSSTIVLNRVSSLHGNSWFRLPERPLFSVLVPIFNRAHLIEECLASVCRQTYKAWELVVVDDGSCDDIDIVMAQYTDVVFIRLAANSGVGNAFRVAAENSSGDIIGMLGSDDALESTAIERMVKAHKSNLDCSLITSSQVPCDHTLTPLGEPEFRPRQTNSLIDGIECGNFATFKREAYLATDGFSSLLRAAVDHDVYLKLEEVGNVGFLDEPLYLYRKHDETVSQGRGASKAVIYDLRSYLAANERRKITSFPRLDATKYHRIQYDLLLRESNEQSVTWFSGLLLRCFAYYHRLSWVLENTFLRKG
jgi:glycosyltransferase involved in cell wall biosynthesis